MQQVKLGRVEYQLDVNHQANADLAQRYYQFIVKEYLFSSQAVKDAKIIAQSPLDVLWHYSNEGSLEELNVRGIGKNIKINIVRLLKYEERNKAAGENQEPGRQYEAGRRAVGE